MSTPIPTELSEARPAHPAPPRNGTVAVTSRRFGAVEVPEDRIVRFARPIIGFESFETYAVIEDEATAPILWLQALDAPEVLFALADAHLVAGSDYDVELSDHAAQAIGLEHAEDARVLCILTLAPEASAVTANLRAPIVWNTRDATALQMPLPDPKLPVRHSCGSTAGEGPRDKEDGRARPQPPQG